jgi:outer membrane protein OmpA-like peptidoglycan-associated protein
MMRKERWAWLGSLAMVFGTSTALAQEAEGFSLNRFEPAERGSDWFASESLDLRGHQRFSAGLVFDYGRKPLVLYDLDGNEQTAIVSDQLFAHAGGTIILHDRFRIGLSLPVALVQDGEGGQIGTTTFESNNDTNIGDVRLSGDVRLLGEYRDLLSVAAGVRLYAPTGSRESYTGDGAFRAALRGAAAGQVDKFYYAGTLAFDFRARDEAYAGSPTGSQVNFTAAAGLSLLDDRLNVGPEIFGSTVVSDSDAFFARRTTPFELLVGGHYLIADAWQVGAGFGPGLTRGFGTPQFRALASITWFQPFDEAAPPPPPPPPPDRDGDGIIDAQDACPHEAGVPSDDPNKNGCPLPTDRDGDTILDEVDACPDEPGDPSEDPKKNGCPPPPDRDEDTVIDELDACPDVPGLVTDEPATNGCPDPDRDADGIENGVDACPDDAGPKNDNPKKNGCPVARVDHGQIVIREQVQFAYNSDRIHKASDTILEAVRDILTKYPHITSVEIQGHSDSKGSDAYNKALSNRRAASVVRWLSAHGIDKARLTSVGYGEERPIADNETEEGRADNRRVEFHILAQSTGDKAAPAAPVEDNSK